MQTKTPAMPADNKKDFSSSLAGIYFSNLIVEREPFLKECKI